MELLPKKVRAHIPRLGMTQSEKDPMVWVKLTNPLSGWRWYLIELEDLATEAICYGYQVGWDKELTYFNLSDLDLHAAQVGEDNQRDATFTPCRVSAVQAKERELHKVPLGRVVATPGALDALEKTRQHPFVFLKRHVQGDWGEVDEHDRAENEFSLTHGFRLLSAYSLADGTRIWIITEADRSATTILLPEEY